MCVPQSNPSKTLTWTASIPADVRNDEESSVASTISFDFSCNCFMLRSFDLMESVNSFDFIQSKQRYEAAVSDNVRAKFDYIFRLKVLEFYFGLPLNIPEAN